MNDIEFRNIAANDLMRDIYHRLRSNWGRRVTRHANRRLRRVQAEAGGWGRVARHQ